MESDVTLGRHFLSKDHSFFAVCPLTSNRRLILWFGLVGNEALSACKTIAELWDGRLRGGGIGLVSAAGGRMAAS